MTAQTTEAWIPQDSFGSRLLLLRREKHLTVEQIAKLCGIAQPTWTTWENGARPRDFLNAVTKIVDATGVDRDWLLWGASDPRRGVSIGQYLPDSADFAAAA